MPSHYPPHWKKDKIDTENRAARLQLAWHYRSACWRVTTLPTKDAALATETCSKQFPGASTERYMARTVPVALKLQCLRQKMVTNAENDASSTERHLDVNAPSTSRCRSSPLGPERVAWPRRSKFSVESRKCLKLYMLQQHTQNGTSVLGNFVPGN